METLYPMFIPNGMLRLPQKFGWKEEHDSNVSSKSYELSACATYRNSFFAMAICGIVLTGFIKASKYHIYTVCMCPFMAPMVCSKVQILTPTKYISWLTHDVQSWQADITGLHKKEKLNRGIGCTGRREFRDRGSCRLFATYLGVLPYFLASGR